jgi:hypothetical protein
MKLATRHGSRENNVMIDIRRRVQRSIRRDFLKLAVAAGIAMANRLSHMLDGATITLIDGHKAHYYQPGLTLVGAGLKPPSYVEATPASSFRETAVGSRRTSPSSTRQGMSSSPLPESGYSWC